MDIAREVTDRIRHLEADNGRLRAVLQRIADLDYRGNRPEASRIAFEALQGEEGKTR